MDDDVLTRLLLTGGLTMMGAKGNPLSVLSQGGLFALQDMNQQKVLAAKLMEEQQQAEARAVALQRQKVLQALLSGGGQQPAGSQRSVVDAPDWKPQVPAAPSQSLAQKLLDAGFTKEAEEYAKAQGAIHGEAYGNIQVTASGKPYYMTKQGPRYVDDNSFVPREELHFVDTGERVGVGMDKFTGQQKSPGLAKGMSPAEKDAASRGWASFGLDKQKFDRGEFSTSVPLPGGGTGAGFITGAGFNQAPGTGAKMPEVPASIQEHIAKNNVFISNIDRALDYVDKQPQAFGLKNMAGDTVRQRTDPEGVDARASVSGIAGQQFHDISGAAVSVAEAARLQPFIPSVKDRAEVVTKKLELLRVEAVQMQRELAAGRSLSQVGALPDNKARGAVQKASPAAIEAELMRRGVRPGA